MEVINCTVYLRILMPYIIITDTSDYKYKRHGGDSNTRSTREPALKAGAVPLGHRGL